MKVSELRQIQIRNGDTVVLPKEAQGFFMSCCGCGLKHFVVVDNSKEDVRMKWTRIHGDPDIKTIK